MKTVAMITSTTSGFMTRMVVRFTTIFRYCSLASRDILDRGVYSNVKNGRRKKWFEELREQITRGY